MTNQVAACLLSDKGVRLARFTWLRRLAGALLAVASGTATTAPDLPWPTLAIRGVDFARDGVKVRQLVHPSLEVAPGNVLKLTVLLDMQSVGIPLVPTISLVDAAGRTANPVSFL